MPSDHVLHFPPSVQHEILYRQQEQPIASHLHQASQVYHRSSPSEIPYQQYRGIYKPDTPTVELVQPFSPLFQHEDYHRQPDFNSPVHQTSDVESRPPVSSKFVEHRQPSYHQSQQQDFNKYQLGYNSQHQVGIDYSQQQRSIAKPERLLYDHVHHFSPSAQYTETYLQQGYNNPQQSGQSNKSQQFRLNTQGKCSTDIQSTYQYQLSTSNTQGGVNRV
ncbi:unnamed protein product [Mytilus coruscus]|uniref:Uncharacterized protein n=1 Tax=Mytilus coruscus TaxID=42192 RepID=A0A6J8DK09_MYTCO|nr:unnamed protein product [Mytilus coruscus]